MKHWLPILLTGACLFSQPAFSQTNMIGQPVLAPKTLNNAQSLDGPSPELYTVDGFSSATAERFLSLQYGDRETLISRGRHDSEIYKALSPAVVIVVTDSGIGSGSYIGADNVLTNWHVVKGFQKVGILFKPQVEGVKPTEAEFEVAEVIKIDPISDLALLRVASLPPNIRPIVLGSESDIQVGADVHAIGHPTGEAWTYTKGFISQYRKNYEWKTEEGLHKAGVIQTQTPINPGNSGGPLISDDAKLVGVNAFKAPGEALNFAISIVDVQKFLSGNLPPPVKKVAACQTKQLYDGRDSLNSARLVQYDTNCDGKADYSFVTPDDTSKPISAHIDSNYDGRTDISVEDRKRNGHWDISYHDVDFDGKIDLVGYHADGKITPTRFEKYVVGFKY